MATERDEFGRVKVYVRPDGKPLLHVPAKGKRVRADRFLREAAWLGLVAVMVAAVVGSFVIGTDRSRVSAESRLPDHCRATPEACDVAGTHRSDR